MKPTSRFSVSSHWRVAFYASLLFFSFFFHSLSFAQPPAFDTITGGYHVTATDLWNGSYATLIGQDATIYPPGCTSTSNYMFTTWQGNPVRIDAYRYNDHALMDATDYNTRVFKNGTEIFSPLSPSGYYWSGLDNNVITFTDPGIYEFYVDELHTFVPNRFYFYIVVIPRIQKVWIEAPPVCDSWTPPLGDNKYHFSIKTEPDIDAVMENFYSEVRNSSCTEIPAIDIHLNLSATNDALSISSPPYFIPITADFYSGNTAFDYISTRWGDSTKVGGYTTHDFSIPYIGAGTVPGGAVVGLKDFLAGGIYARQSLYLKVTLNDGIPHQLWEPATLSVTGTTAVPIQSSVADVIAHPGNPSVTPSYLSALATPGGRPEGTPNPSFDFYDYRVTPSWPSDVWTAASNPVARLHGNAVKTIRIEHQLIIEEGARLDNQLGLRIEMGPGGQVIVNRASSSAMAGGFLQATDDTITAYRGCGGTDQSTWGGVTVMGDPTWEQGYFSMPQGAFYMSGGELSYADIAVQNGTTPSQAGGVIYCSGGHTQFYNNKEAVKLWPYHEYDYTGKERMSIIKFADCKFITDQNAWFVPDHFIKATDVMGIDLSFTTFLDTTAGYVMAQGVAGSDAGMIMDYATVRNLKVGINALYGASTHTAFINATNFVNNKCGVRIMGGIANKVINNTFTIPAYSGPVFITPLTPDVVLLNDQNIGVLMMGSSGYTVANNIFQTDAAAHAGPLYYPNTTGTLEYNTGSDPNQVSDNTFIGLGTAMLSNFKNNVAGTGNGLIYSCNTDTHVNYDIAAVGYGSAMGGINANQYTLTTSPSTVVPAGNKFDGDWNIFNQQYHLAYFYSATLPMETPAHYKVANVLRVPTPGTPNCAVPAGPGPYILGGGASKMVSSGHESHTSSDEVDIVDNGTYQNYALAVANVNYYLTDTNNSLTGNMHRDSVYYWAGQMNTAYGDLLITNLLIADGLTDSASTVYNAISSKYELSSAEANEFNYGRSIIDILINERTAGGSIYSLSGADANTLREVRDNTTMWAHCSAEAILYTVTGEAMTDTLLYPNAPAPEDTGGEARSSTGSQPVNTTGSPATANRVYPNPATDVLQVMYTAISKDGATIQIEDVSGRIVITQPLKTGELNSVDVSRLMPGMYLYRILEGKQNMMTGKVAKY